MLRTGLFAASIGPWLLLASLYNINILVRVRLKPALAPICDIPKQVCPSSSAFRSSIMPVNRISAT